MVKPLVVAALITVATGCSVALDAGDAAVTCRSDAECPEGRCELSIQRCVGSGVGTPLRLTSASAASVVRVVAVFNQPVAPLSIVDLSQVSITPALTVSALELDVTGQRLAVTTSEQTFNVIYTLTVDGLVSDRGDGLEDTARSQPFVSFLGQAETAPPAPIRPLADDLVTASDVELVWQPVQGAGSYTVEVTRSDVAGGTVTVGVPGDATTAHVSLPDEGTYDWRVRADITEPGVYGSASFDRLIDAIYVSCPADPCPSRTGNGSRRAPVRRIADGILLAQQLGLPEVRVAARSGVLAYDEAMVFGDIAVTVDGGFDAMFAPSAVHATAARTGTVVVVRPAAGQTRLLNFNLRQDNAPSIEVVSIEGPADVLFENVDVTAGIALGDAVGITIDGDPGTAHVELVGSSVEVNGPVDLYASVTNIALRARRADLVMTDTRLWAGLTAEPLEDTTMVGLRLEDATRLTALRVNIAAAYGRLSVALDDQRPASAALDAGSFDIVDASRLWVPAAGAFAAFGVRVEHRRSLIVRNSIISTGPTTSGSIAIRIAPMAPGDGPRFIDDLVVATNAGPAIALQAEAKGYIVAGTVFHVPVCTVGCGGAHVCLSTGADSGPSTLLGSALACPTAYLGLGLGVADVAELTGPTPDCNDNGGTHIRCGGIVAITDLELDATYADFIGNDNDPYFITDADLHYQGTAPTALRGGGPDLSADTCGYVELPSVTCGASGVDAESHPRGDPFSMGPYEY